MEGNWIDTAWRMVVAAEWYGDGCIANLTSYLPRYSMNSINAYL